MEIALLHQKWTTLREMGPMGPEAFAFETREEADAFAGKNGGEVLRFQEVTYNRIMGK